MNYQFMFMNGQNLNILYASFCLPHGKGQTLISFINLNKSAVITVSLRALRKEKKTFKQMIIFNTLTIYNKPTLKIMYKHSSR